MISCSQGIGDAYGRGSGPSEILVRYGNWACAGSALSRAQMGQPQRHDLELDPHRRVVAGLSQPRGVRSTPAALSLARATGSAAHGRCGCRRRAGTSSASNARRCRSARPDGGGGSRRSSPARPAREISRRASRREQGVLRPALGLVDVLVGRDDVEVADQKRRQPAVEQVLGMGVQPVHPGELVVELRARATDCRWARTGCRSGCRTPPPRCSGSARGSGSSGSARRVSTGVADAAQQRDAVPARCPCQIAE